MLQCPIWSTAKPTEVIYALQSLYHENNYLIRWNDETTKTISTNPRNIPVTKIVPIFTWWRSTLKAYESVSAGRYICGDDQFVLLWSSAIGYTCIKKCSYWQTVANIPLVRFCDAILTYWVLDSSLSHILFHGVTWPTGIKTCARKLRVLNYNPPRGVCYCTSHTVSYFKALAMLCPFSHFSDHAIFNVPVGTLDSSVV